MIHRERLNRPKYVYPNDEWRLVEKRFHPDLIPQTETFFATANGYFGMRGGCEEGSPAFHAGTFINGFYETWPIVYGEDAYGFAKTGQTIANVTDGKIIKLYVDDEPFHLPDAILHDYERALDMKQGTLDRTLLWETRSGKKVSIKSRRLVSFEHRHLAAIEYEVTVLDAEAPVVISSQSVAPHGSASCDEDDPRRARGFEQRVLLPEMHYAQDQRALISHVTRSSRMALACGIDHVIETECPYACQAESSDDQGKVVFSVEAQPGVPIRITKYITYQDSRRSSPRQLCERAERTLDRAVAHGFGDLLASQRRFLDRFWADSDIAFTGAPELQQAIRFNLFHILQASARADRAGIPAKGLTGQGYEGHYFWDTEIYVLPFLIYTNPRVARNLLEVRYQQLDHARKRAREVNQKGALFPWRTIGGEEASAYYAAGTAQYHINAAVMYAIKKYVEVTGDVDFLERRGAEILVETARLWADLGFYSESKDGKFCIHGVTGPDEYNAVVDNNTYTNLMARENLRYAVTTVEALRKQNPDRFTILVDRTGLELSEIQQWRRAAESMYIPFDEALGIHPQDDAFTEREPWDLENTPAEKFPLLLHHHPLVIYRHKVIKQADVVLAMFLLGHEFTPEQIRQNFDYYDPLTTGDSSLSMSIQAIVAAELGYRDKAREYAIYGAMMDLADVGGNVKDGLHIASMGGTWMAMVYGLAGLRDWEGRITFRPRRPLVEDVTLHLRIRGCRLDLSLTPDTITYSLGDGDRLQLWHEDEEIRLTRAKPTVKRALD
jgi:alpha,alpha-trehalose phosphorylase